MNFVDTNFFLRFFRADIQSQYLQVKELFLEANKGKVKLATSTIVFFEINWVLKSYYAENKKNILNVLKKTLKLSFIFIEERSILEKALEIFENTSLSLEDCYNIVSARKQGIKTFKTFDVKLERKAKELL